MNREDGDRSVRTAIDTADLAVLVSHVSLDRRDRGQPRGKPAGQPVGHHSAPREPGHIDAIGVDPVGRLQAVDQVSDERDVIDAFVVTAAIGLPSIEDGVRIGNDPASPVSLGVEAGGHLFEESIGVSCVQVED